MTRREDELRSRLRSSRSSKHRGHVQANFRSSTPVQPASRQKRAPSAPQKPNHNASVTVAPRNQSLARNWAHGLTSKLTKAGAAGMKSYRSASKQARIRAGGAVAALAAGVIMIGVATHGSSEIDDSPASLGATTESSEARNTEVVVLDQPDFEPLLPGGVSAGELEQSETRKTPSEQVIFSYRDTVQGLSIEVTQQTLPDNLQGGETAQLEELADGFQMREMIAYDGGQIYYGIAERNNVQSLVTIKDEVLIFIRSPQQLGDEAWVAYVTNLQ